jgi:phosphoglycerate dehydrogenase-like enzyme
MYMLACLDRVNIGFAKQAYEVEPLPADSPLRGLDNVLLSPHVSGMDTMAERKVTERCVSNILNFLGGQKDLIRPYIINPETLMENSR